MPKLRQPTLADFILLIALLFAAVELAQALVNYLSVAGEALRFPFPLEYGEGPVLEQAVRLARGEAIYLNSFAQSPWRVTQDPPMFHLAQMAFVAGNPAFGPGRAISIASAIACAVLVALIVHRLTDDWLAAALSGLILFAFPHIASWSLFNRADTFALALSLAGLNVTLRWARRWWGVGLAAGLFVASGFTQPAFVLAAPATAFAWLFWSQGLRRQAIALIGLVAGSSLALFGAMNLATAGGFALNVFIPGLGMVEWFRLIGLLINLFVHAAFLFIGGFIFLILERSTERKRAWPFAVPYITLSLLATLTAGRADADVNDLNQLVAAVCVLLGSTIAWVSANAWLRVAALIVVAFQLADLREWTQDSYLAATVARMTNPGELAQLSAEIKQVERDVLADEYMGLLPINDKRIYLQPAEFTRLQAQGLWSDAQLIEQINRQQFRLIALYEPTNADSEPLIVQRWPKPVRDAIYANYQVRERLADALIYVPK
jgi:hypothetical protein